MEKDKSQVDVATHEICHSWFGNEVTCQNWQNMWLNEGFTVFCERHVTNELEKAQKPEFAKVEAFLGNASMVSDMRNYGFDNSFSALYPEIAGYNPDDSFSTVPYEKGYQFLVYLESIVGEIPFRDFLRFHINKYSQQSVDYNMVRKTWEEYIPTDDNIPAEKKTEALAVDWEEWVVKPGMPPVTADFSTNDQAEAEALADDYIARGGKTSPDNYKDYTDPDKYYANKKVIFALRLLDKKEFVTYQIIKKIDEDLDITDDEQPEVWQQWFPLCIAVGYKQAFSNANKFIQTVGRMKYINPVYQAYVRYGFREIALDNYMKAKDFYHPIAAAGIRKMLLQEPKPEDEELLEKHQRMIKKSSRIFY